MIRSTLLTVLLLSSVATAGEVKLREFHTARSAIIRVADIAELVDISDEDRREIERLPLFPAPQEGLARRVTAQDVREVMSLYGMSFPKLRVCGECRVEGAALAAVLSSPIRAVGLAPTDESQTGDESRRGQAPPLVLEVPQTSEKVLSDLLAYLQNKDRIRTEWNAEFHLSEAQAKAIEAMERPEISGGLSPWTGRQSFSIRDRAVPNSKPLTFHADVKRMAHAVVTTRSLEAGDLIGERDVELGEISPSALTSGVLVNLHDVLGKQLKRATPSGQIVQLGMVQKPIVVKRGELVTVYSVAAGVQVKAVAKSLADAGVGDVIQLESPDSKKQFQARVTAPQEAMVFIDTPTVAVEQQAVRSPGNETR